MVKREDLLGFFDQIVTTHALNPAKPILAFVDEINALVGNEPLYSSFLAPLEDRHYYRDGRTCPLPPCVWVFVGTEPLGEQPVGYSPELKRAVGSLNLKPPVATQPDPVAPGATTPSPVCNYSDPASDRSRKRSDFESRLTLPPFILNTKPDNSALQSGKALERVYLGALFVKAMYPHVDKISRKVLVAFAALDPAVTLRDLKHDLQECKGIKRSELKWDNLPPRFKQRFGFLWKRTNAKMEALKYGSEPLKLEDLLKPEVINGWLSPEPEVLVAIVASLETSATEWQMKQEELPRVDT